MFNTFAVSEPSWNNGVGRRKIPKNPAMNIYSLLTFKDLLNDLQTAKASPDLVAALNHKVSGGIHVPRDFPTLEEAVGFFERYADSDSVSFSMIKDGADAEHKANKDPDIVTIPRKIVVGKGEHQIPRTIYLTIRSAMHIVGDPGVPKEEIVVVGGILFLKGIQGNCHLQNLTIRQAKHSGVEGQSSFTMADVLVEQCHHHGVVAYGTDGRCTNVEVRQCGWSGVVAHSVPEVVWLGESRGSIILVGDQTTVHHNCTKGDSDDYGLVVEGSSIIQLVAPLTKEQVSTDNGGGGNWSGGDSRWPRDELSFWEARNLERALAFSQKLRSRRVPKLTKQQAAVYEMGAGRALRRKTNFWAKRRALANSKPKLTKQQGP